MKGQEIMPEGKASKTIIPKKRNNGVNPYLNLNMGCERKLKFHKYCLDKGGMTQVINKLIDKALKK